MTIVIVDTSVFCNLLRVPKRHQHSERALAELEELLESGASLLLPLATIYETGNHIAQQGDGRERRAVARCFVEQVREAYSGEAPWSPTPFHDGTDLTRWLDTFPDEAARGVGLGDLSILQIFHEQCRLHPGRQVRVWSYDRHLDGYDRRP